MELPEEGGSWGTSKRFLTTHQLVFSQSFSRYLPITVTPRKFTAV